MCYYSTKSAEFAAISGKTGFWLHFFLRDVTAWIDANLPTPHYLQHAGQSGAFVAWLIDGFPATKRGQAFLNDVIARFVLTLAAERLAYRPYIEERRESAHIHDGRPVKLKELARGLKSLPSRVNAPIRADNFADHTFWAIKLHVEDLIRANGEGVMIPYQALEAWAMTQFVGHKERSTIRAKCRSVWNWYDSKGWTIPKRRRFEMSRTEAATRASAIKAERARKAVESAVTGLMAETYKKKNGKWNIAKIADDLKMSRDTVRKYLKELEIETLL
jgi:AraC-like DNA-binding protein